MNSTPDDRDTPRELGEREAPLLAWCAAPHAPAADCNEPRTGSRIEVQFLIFGFA